MSPVRSVSAPCSSAAGGPGPGARYWILRYGLQDLAAALALGVAALAGASWPAHRLGPLAALSELCAFYGVAYLRLRREARGRRRGTLLRMAAEYGPAEALDLVLRPALLTVCAAWIAVPGWGPAPGLFAGSLLADLLFYLGAARSHRARRRKDAG